MRAKEVSVVILAGGKSTRMGQDKAVLKWGKADLLNHIVEKLYAHYKEVIVVSNKPRNLHKPVKLVVDIFPDRGPLSGIHSGLCHSTYENSIIVGCDMPFVTPLFLDLIVSRMSGFDAVVPLHSRGEEYLCACYSESCIPIIERQLKCGNNRVSSMLDKVNCFYYQEEEWSSRFSADNLFCNLNTYEEYRQYLAKEC